MFKSAANVLRVLLFSTLSVNASAESLTNRAFRIQGGQVGYIERNEVYAAWNANDPVSVLKPGMKVMFFGQADGCNARAAGGPVTNQGNPHFDDALHLTGIPLAHEGQGQRWSPSGDSDKCDSSVRNKVGESFIHLNNDPVNGGIGIVTITGPDQAGRQSFFRQFDKMGKNNTGANASIEGSFVSFRFAWQKGNAVRPWAGDSQPVDKHIAEFRSVQTVASESVGDGLGGARTDVVQAKQEFIVALINQDCVRRLGPQNRSCVFQYVFNIAVYRAGVTDWNQERWFRNAGLFFDPAQGGMAVVHGPIGHSGETTFDDATRLGLYTSLGDSTYHEVFSKKTFRIQVTFDQFKNSLRIISGKLKNKRATDVTPSDLRTVFGEKWDDPDQWLLATINVAQEVYNPIVTRRAYIGGSIKDVAVGAAPLD